MNKPAPSNNESGQILPLTAVFVSLFALGIFSLGQLGVRAINIAKAEATADIIGHAIQTAGQTTSQTEIELSAAKLASELTKTAHQSAQEIAQKIAQANSSELLNLQLSEDSVIVEIEHKGHKVSVIVGK